MSSENKKNYVLVVVLLILGSLLSGCKKEEAYSPLPPSKVTVETPQQKTVVSYLEFTGLTEATEEVELRPRVEGYLEKVLFKPGSLVKKGDLLFVIDQKPYRARLQEAKAQLAIEVSRLKAIEATLQRREMAYKEQAVSEVEIIQGRADVEVAKAAIESAKSNVDTAELELSYTMIHAPVSGRIDRNLVDEGNLLSAGEHPLLATIVRDESIYVYFNVNERELIDSGLLTGDLKTKEVSLNLLSDEKSHMGRIDYMSNRVDPETGNIQVRGVFENSEMEMLPGMFARVRVPAATIEDALLVPNHVLGRDQQGDYLLSVTDENIVQYNSVETGPLIGDMRVIRSGIGKDTSVIVNGIQKAYPGSEVSPMRTGSENNEASEDVKS